MMVFANKKIKVLLVGGGLIAGAYVAIKYLLPLVWPFILSYGLAVLIFPVVRFLRDKLHFHKNAATGLTLIFALGGITALISMLAYKITAQIMELAKNWPSYQEKFLGYLHNICTLVEKTIKIDGNAMYERICENICNAIDGWQKQIMPAIMNNSFQTLMIFIDVVVVIALTVMAVFYMTRDMDDIRKIDENNLFFKELNYFKGLMSRILRAYIRSQVIIMSIVAVICCVGLAAVGNNYYMLIGILIGILDALPLFGVGAVMVPWSIVYVFTGDYFKAAVMFTVFMACYLVREFLEPRLMGQSVGMSPIASLVSIYAGYQLFGFLGMIAGPLIYVFVREVISGYCS